MRWKKKKKIKNYYYYYCCCCEVHKRKINVRLGGMKNMQARLIGTYVCDCKESELLNSIKVQRGEQVSSADASFFNSVDVPVSPLFMCEQYEEEEEEEEEKLVRARSNIKEPYRTLRRHHHHGTADSQHDESFTSFRISETRLVPASEVKKKKKLSSTNIVGRSSREEYLRSFKFSKQPQMKDRIHHFLFTMWKRIHVARSPNPCGCVRSLPPIPQPGRCDSKLGSKRKKLHCTTTSGSRPLESKRAFSDSFSPSGLLNSILFISANPLLYMPHMPPYF